MQANQTNDSRCRAAELGALLARHYPSAAPHTIAQVVFDMQRAAKRAVAWELRCCNEPMTEELEAAGHGELRKAEDTINARLRWATLEPFEGGQSVPDQPSPAPVCISPASPATAFAVDIQSIEKNPRDHTLRGLNRFIRGLRA